jgi:hypothetical protein
MGARNQRFKEPDDMNTESKAYLVGGGIGTLAAAAFMIRDGKLPGENISILEATPMMGGSLDGAGEPTAGYSLRGGRMLTTGSVSSQADTERADLHRERKELAADPLHEHAELAAVYVGRGLDSGQAADVATQLMAHDALGPQGRDELSISDALAARPVQATLASAGTFSVGAVLPLLIVLLVPDSARMWAVSGGALLFLALLGSIAARAGGAFVMTAATRVTFLGRTGNGLDCCSRGIVWSCCVRFLRHMIPTPDTKAAK